MATFQRLLLYSISFACMSISFIDANAPIPRLTVIFVIDQFSYEYIRTLRPFLRCGIGRLLDKGNVYANAHHPHAPTTTALGHTGLETGVYPKDHGIVENTWIDPEGADTSAVHDSPKHAAVFSPTGLYNFGRSPHNIMVDGICEQFVLATQPFSSHKAFAISWKDRAAICMANKLGKAIWFDDQSGMFTSSKAYFNTLPAWLVEFNNTHNILKKNAVVWQTIYYHKGAAYNFKNAHNYTYAPHQKILINSVVPIERGGKHPYEAFKKTPSANKLVLDLARTCVEKNISCNRADRLLVWVSLSGLDYLGHDYGPQSAEAIDMVYHLDRQIGQFMRGMRNSVHPGDTLYILTADHGVSPIPELVHHAGIKSAGRLNYVELTDYLNDLLLDQFELEDLIVAFKPPYIYLDQQQLDEYSSDDQKIVLSTLKESLQRHPGIARVWSYDELSMKPVEAGSIESFFKNSLYPGRSGQLIVQLSPYVLATQDTFGTGHEMPYNYNTHVPLVMYQKRVIEREIFYEKVWTLQLANTLAHIFDVPCPSASTFNVLPGIILQGCEL